MKVSIDTRLLSTAHIIGNTPFSTILLKNDNRFFWIMVVPRHAHYSEIFDLSDEDYRIFMDEIKKIAFTVKSYTNAIKMNVETIGNVIPSLHMHIIARLENDCCWPKPIWTATNEPVSYASMDVSLHKNKLIELLKLEIVS
jgi:diadenosine tetraphosphate (Ap4A) HIT family hydrolase